jgi:hypothetical protein
MVPKQSNGVIPIRRDIRVSDADQEVADFAYCLWLARGFRGGSPEDDLLTAWRKLRGRAPTGLFLVPERKSNLHRWVATRHHLGGGSQ